MILTLTANPAMDRTLIVSGFQTGATNRADVARVDIGGKGINVAQNLARLGCDVVATGFLAADDTRGVLAALGAQGIVTDFVRVSGDIRVNLKILDVLAGVETEINEVGRIVPGEAVDALTAKLRVLASRCEVMVLSGSLPPGVPDDLYARLIEIAAAAGVRTVLDTAGEPLRHGIAAGPDIVKPNRGEAEELLRMEIRDDGELVAAADRLLAMGARAAVISVGSAGALSASPAGFWRARPPAIAARNTVGAGDAMVAGLAYALTQSQPPVNALHLATALGCAAAASAAPYPSADRVSALMPQVQIDAVKPAGHSRAVKSTAP
jgi:1-phosphofructokinase